ncbi:hypothetical protein EHQ58_17770 [Leptospira ognonensis]|uniref:Uncharacterized protein n=1 Tax=Leptospira ognonensis TaxID=2484945 RepID=A0A4R9JVT1_9LEPT|nr:hypothetical protein [Leptospira ognonensis]TGL56466.1 hypothetical protein EHQ58_17770 [Leptospira ognonensis]
MNHNQTISLFLLPLTLLLFFVNCQGKEDNQGMETNVAILGILNAQTKATEAAAAAAKVCETTIDDTYASGSYVSFCSPTAGTGKFIRITGVKALGNNGYLYLFFGYSATPTSVTPSSTGQYQFVIGKSVSNTNPFAWFRNSEYGNYQGGQTLSGANPSLSLSSEKEICINLSGTDVAPKVNFWVTGVNNADCQSKTTLTSSSAIIEYNSWPLTTNVFSKSSTSHYFRLSSTALLTASKIFVSSDSIL